MGKDAVLGRLTAAFTALFAPAGLALAFVFRILTGRFRPVGAGSGHLTAWYALWSLFFLPLLLFSLIRADWPGVQFLGGQFVLALVASTLLVIPRKLVLTGLGASLVVFLAAGLLEWQKTSASWQIAGAFPSQRGTAALYPGERLKAESGSLFARRTWETVPSERGVLSFEVRLRSGVPGWDWIKSSPEVDLEPEVEGSTSFTRVTMPAAGDPYIAREVELGTPLAGRIFRVSAVLRSEDEIPSSRCVGLRLREVGGAETTQCFDTSFGPSWQPLTGVWQAPPQALSTTLRLAFNNVDGYSFDIRDVMLEVLGEDGWQALGPLIPNGVSAQLHWRDEHGESHIAQGGSLIPTSTWQSYRLEASDLPDRASTRISAVLRVGDGLGVDVRNTRLTTPGASKRPRQERFLSRQQLWFGHPNLAGHTIAVAGLGFGALASSPLLFLGGSLAALAGILLTGSRAALLGALVGLTVLAFLQVDPHGRHTLRKTLGFGSGLILLFTAIFTLSGRLEPGNVINTVSRSDIWTTVWELFTRHVWTGWGYAPLGGLWPQTYPGTSTELVSHAHNLWLELAVSYGVLGLLLGLVLTLGLLALAWRWCRWRGLAVVGPVFIMNVFDYTFFYTGVFCTLILALNALGRHRFRAEEPSA